MKTLHGHAARKAIKNGVDIIADAVKVTLGPKGNNVLIQNLYGAPSSTKDGVTVAKALDLDNPVFDMGAQLIKEAAAQTVDQVGDGTTTVTVLTQALLANGFSLVDKGVKSIEIKRRWLENLDIVVGRLNKDAIPVKDNLDLLKSVAKISANNDEYIGNLIADTFEKIGEDGAVKVVTSSTNKVDVVITNGSTYDNGYITPHFVTDETTMRAEYSDANIMIVNGRLTKGELFFEALHFAQENPLLIICDEIDNESLSLAVLNAQQAGLKLVIVVSPGFGDARRSLLQDIAITTGATILNPTNMKETEGRLRLALGSASNIIVTKDDFCIINGKNYASEAITGYVDNLKTTRSLLEEKADINFIDKRIASLIGKVATIKVGANSEIEMKELKDRIDDAVSAVAAALEEGVVIGGGNQLAIYANNLEDIKSLTEIDKAYFNALMAPWVCIMSNASLECSKYYGSTDRIMNVADGIMTDPIEAGIVDPMKVTKIALTTATSIAATVLTTECLIYKDYNEK